MADRAAPPVVVITGASAGVGRATAHAFARQGARIGLLARSRGGLDAAKQEVEQLGGEALVLPTDMAAADQVEAAAAAVEATYGPIDVWVNNAMVSVFSPIKAMTADEFRRVTEVTYLGCVHGTFCFPTADGDAVSAAQWQPVPKAAQQAFPAFRAIMAKGIVRSHFR